MSRQMTAERAHRAVVTEAEGTRTAAVTVAEGDKRGSILRADGFNTAMVYHRRISIWYSDPGGGADLDARAGLHEPDLVHAVAA